MGALAIILLILGVISISIPPPKCPKCKSDNTECILAGAEESRQCKDCGAMVYDIED